MTEPRKPLTAEGLAALSSISWVRLSHDGEQVAYYSDETGRLELFVLDLRTGRRRQVSHGDQARTVGAPPAWSRDGQTIVFARDRNGDEQHQLYRLSLDDGTVTPLVTGDAQHHPVEVSPDNTRLTVNVVSKDRQFNVYTVPLDGGALEPLTDFNAPALGGHWHPSGEWVVFGANASSNGENWDIYRVPAAGGEPEVLLSVADGSKEYAGRFSTDGTLLAVTSNATGTLRAGVLDWSTGDVTWVGDGGWDEMAEATTPDNRRLVTLAARDGQTVPILYDLEGGLRRYVDVPPGVVDTCLPVLGGTALLMKHQATNHRPRLLLYQLEAEEAEVVLPADYGDFDPEGFFQGLHCSYPSFDGLDVGAIIYSPPKGVFYTDNPAVVLVHGGPGIHDSLTFDPFAQLLASRGYVVLKPNYRGSSGYGRAFEEANRGDIGGGDVEDLRAGIRFLESLQMVCLNRVAIVGRSYGGYLTYQSMVKHPDVWAAGVATVGITDWLTLYRDSQPHFQKRIVQLFGDIEENEALLRDRSPVTYAHRLKAPLLMVQAANDPRCPLAQARLFRDRLVELGKVEGDDFEYVELGDQGHGSMGIEDKVASWNRVLDFLERRLGP